MTLLSDTGYLNDVQLYPARHDLYDYFATVRFSVAIKMGCFVMVGGYIQEIL